MLKHLTDSIRHGDTNAKDDVSAHKELYVGWLESEDNLIKSPSLSSVGRILMLISCLENARRIPFHVIEQLEEVDNISSVLQLKKPSPRTHWSLAQSSVLFSRSVVSGCLWPRGLQHTRLPCPSPTHGIYSDSCPLSQWYHPTISYSVVPFSSHPQSFPASGSFQISQFFASGGQSIGVSASASVLSMKIQDWFPLGWTGWISLQSKGLSRVFSNTTVQKHQFFGTQLSL